MAEFTISSYLEAKRIKNLYMLDDTTDTDDSDFESIEGETKIFRKIFLIN